MTFINDLISDFRNDRMLQRIVIIAIVLGSLVGLWLSETLWGKKKQTEKRLIESANLIWVLESQPPTELKLIPRWNRGDNTWPFECQLKPL